MAYHSGSGRLELMWPAKGIDRSTALALQPPGTCVFARNVRTYDLRNRQAGGKRSGLAAAFTAAVTGGLRVTGIIPITQSTGFTSDGLMSEAVTLTVADLDDDNPFVFAAQPETQSLSAFSMNSTPQGSWVKQTGSPAGETLQLNAGGSGSSSINYGAAITRRTTNDITVKILALDTAAGSGTSKLAGEPVDFGPFIRAADDYRTFIGCRVAYVSADVVEFQIVHYAGGTSFNSDVATPVVVAASNTTLNGSGTRIADCTFRIWLEGDDVRAQWTWDGAGSGGTDISESLTATAADFIAAGVTNLSGNQAFGGFGVVGDAGTEEESVDITEVSWTQFTEAVAPTVLQQLNPGTETGDGSGNQYYLPPNWTTSFWDNSSSSRTVQAGEDSQSGFPTNGLVYVDLTAGTITFDDETTDDRTMLYRTTDDGVEGKAVRYVPNWSQSNSSPYLGAAFLVDDDDDSFLFIQLESGGTYTDPNTTGGVSFGVWAGYYVNGVETTLQRGSQGNNTSRVIHCNGSEDNLEFRYEDNTLKLVINSRTAWSYELDSSDLTAISSITSNTKVALLYLHSANDGESGATQFRNGTFSIIDRSGDQSVSTTDQDLVLLTAGGSVESGSIGGGLTPATGSGLSGEQPNGFSFNGKVYAVDAEGARIIDPNLNTVDTWSGDGNLNPNTSMFGFAVLYRGRAVLARSATSPALWYMSRQFDPNNFDTSATPEATAAVAGTLTASNVVGAPQEPIVALIPWQDDYLIFGGANSMSMLEGDPGYQGAIFPLTQGVGILGGRAWAFDDKDNLYFLGSSGLYRLPRGGREPINISGRRLATRLDQVDADSTFIQLAYDAYKKTLHIFLTPINGTDQGVHVVYDTFLDAFWEDVYPLAAGPWAVAPIRGNKDEDRRVLLGGNDGWVRRFLDSATGDLADGGASSDAINARIKFGPIETEAGWERSMITEFHATSSADSGVAELEFFTADTPEELEDTVFGGGTTFNVFGNGAYTSPRRLRIRGGAHQIALRQNSSINTFSMERIRIMIAPTGARRRANG
jgi:hypothetical protein